jgi:UDP-GlcNAc:undecaprenyl-phosphate GlcNAc-1-phosphate transferase
MNLHLLDFICFLSLLLSILITRYMIRVNIADIPVERSSHTRPTPRSGGVAIVVSFMCFMIMIDQVFLQIITPHMLVIFLSSIGIAALGLIDDITHLSYKLRLILQICLATIVVLSGLPLKVLVIPGFPPLSLGPYASYISVLWIVGFMNAVNFMDGLNGIVGGCTMIVLAFLAYLTPMTQPLFYIFLGFFIATAGFMRYNFHYGRIFLGDVGSQFLGFMIAAFALECAHYSLGKVDFFSIILLFLPFLYDVKFTFIRRALKGRSVFVAHREHLYQLLNRSGWSHDQVCLLYFSYTILSGLGVVYLHNHPHNILWVIPYALLYAVHTYCVLRYARIKGVAL